jgi:nitric oxide reductase large subunit
MKKYLNLAMGYAIAAMAGGVFYREFTKWNHFSGITMLSKVHAHLFMLGMMVFLLVALFSRQMDLEKEKSFRRFFLIYNIGLPLTVLMMLVRGIIQVKETALSAGADAAISGIAGIGHILLSIGLLLLLVTLKRAAEKD